LLVTDYCPIRVTREWRDGVAGVWVCGCVLVSVVCVCVREREIEYVSE
jgi:hypothetical protein